MNKLLKMLFAVTVIIAFQKVCLSEVADGKVVLEAANGKIQGESLLYEAEIDRIFHWSNPDGCVNWSFKAPESGYYSVLVTCAHGWGPSQYTVTVGDQKVTGYINQIRAKWSDFVDDDLGTVKLEKGKSYDVVLQATVMPTLGTKEPLQLRKITLEPAKSEWHPNPPKQLATEPGLPEGLATMQDDGTIVLEGKNGKIDFTLIDYAEAVDRILAWSRPEARVDWSFTAPASGHYAVIATISRGWGYAEYMVNVGDQKVTGYIPYDSDPDYLFTDEDLGTVNLTKGTPYDVWIQATLMPTQGLREPFQLRRITLKPVKEERHPAPAPEIVKGPKKESVPVAPAEAADGSIVLKGCDGKLKGPLSFVKEIDRVMCWGRSDAKITWSITAPESGNYAVIVNAAYGWGPSEYAVTVGDQKVTGYITHVRANWNSFLHDDLGTVKLEKGTPYDITIQATKMPTTGNKEPLQLRKITLKPVKEERHPAPPAPEDYQRVDSVHQGVAQVDSNGSIIMKAGDGKFDWNMLGYAEEIDRILAWGRAEAKVTWSFTAPKSGYYALIVQAAYGWGPSEYTVSVGDQKLIGYITHFKANWSEIVDDNLGMVKLEEGKTYNVVVQATKMPALGSKEPLQLRRVTLESSATMRSREKEEREVRMRQPRRPRDFRPFEYTSTAELGRQDSERVMKLAAQIRETMDKVNAKGPYKPTWESLDAHPVAEWFKDAKFGMFIDWGLYSCAAYAPSGYPDWYLWRAFYGDTREYHKQTWGEDFRRDDFIPLFKAKDFNPEKIAETAKAAGMTYVIPFLKHHDGFCLWPSSFTFRNAKDMVGPGRDLAIELREECRKRDLKYGFYFSIEEWEYPIIQADGSLGVRLWQAPEERIMTAPYTDAKYKGMISGKIPVKDFYNDYINPQAVEFIQKYDPDIIWLDGDWIVGAEERNTRPLAAYYFNQAEGRKEVVLNDRLGMCRYEIPTVGQKITDKPHGDYGSSENRYQSGGDDIGLSRIWEECSGLSESFGYNWRETDKNVRSSEHVIQMLVKIVSMGGNLLLMCNLTSTGELDPLLVTRLEAVGAWLKVNGEGIYGTRKNAPYKEGASTWFTRSKDGKTVYAFLLRRPEGMITLKSVHPRKGAEIVMLDTKNKPLSWTPEGEGLRIDGIKVAEKSGPIWCLRIPVEGKAAK